MVHPFLKESWICPWYNEVCESYMYMYGGLLWTAPWYRFHFQLDVLVLASLSTIMDKSSWWTPRKRTVWLNAQVFQSPIFTFQPPLPFSMLYPRDSVNEAYFNIEKGKRGFSYPQKRHRKRLFCSSVSTLVLDCSLLTFSVCIVWSVWPVLPHWLVVKVMTYHTDYSTL